MSQKLLYLISFVLVLGMSGNALAEDVDWNNAGGDRRWDNPLNWLGKDTATAHVPTADDKAGIRNSGIGPIIDSSTTAVANQMPVGDQSNSGTVDITGGSLTTNSWFIFGYGDGTEGTFNVRGGTTTVSGSGTDLTVGRAGIGHLNISAGSIEVGDRMYIGSETSGTGYVTMTGGSITINDDFYIGDDGTAHIDMSGGLITIADDLRAYSGTVHMNVSGGEISIGDRLYVGNGTGGEAHLTMTGGLITLGGLMATGRDGSSGEVHLDGGTLDIGNWLEMSSRASIDITGGTLIIAMDDITDDNGTYRSISPWIDDGRISAYGGIGTLNVDYNTNPGKTTLTATLEQASKPEPEHEETGVFRTVVLSWTPGELADTHDIYFGKVFDDVNDADGSDPRGVLAHQGQVDTTYDPGRLDFGQTYYWRIDEVNATPESTIFKGPVWSFTVEPEGVPLASDLITATASSVDSNQIDPNATINRAGLDEKNLHNDEKIAMWLCSVEDPEPWIQYDFDKAYKLHEMKVWNHNSDDELTLGYGIQQAKIETSVDGETWTEFDGLQTFNQAPGIVDYAANTTVSLGGVIAQSVRITALSNWSPWPDIFTQKGLSEVRFFSIPLSARKPSPDSGAAGVDVDVVLGWQAGREAATHNVYLSTDQQAVKDGTAAAVSVTDASYSPSDPDLDLASTYYWRIDEVNEAKTPPTWQGDVWSFSTQEYFVVDDFESYNAIDDLTDPASHRIFESWEDGYATPTTNGALVGVDNLPYTETRVDYVHSGAQAMPYSYGNNGKSSVGTLTLTGTARDFTRHGVGQLSLWFRGESTNAVEPIYVALNGIAIAHNNPNATQVDAYEEWVIPLQDFATLGVTLNNVTSIAIIIGTPTPGAASGAGTMSFDDLRLYRITP